MRSITLICLLCTFIVITACNNDNHEPTSTNLRLSFAGDPPSYYDCSIDSRFEVDFRPRNDPDLSGDYLKMFFRLEIWDTVFYESNDIDFPLSHDSVQNTVHTLEFGGAVEGEYARENYDLVGYLALVQNGQFADYVTTKGEYLGVTEKTYFFNTMHIEYDCQSSYNIGADTLDTFAKLAAAFHIADTDTDFLRDDLNLPDRLVPWDSLGWYHVESWSNTAGYNMHLLAIQGIENNTDSTTGASTGGGPYGYSFVFVQDILTFNPINALFTLYKTTVHELGHQRGGLRHASGRHDPHPEDHDCPFCVMNQDNGYSGNNDNNPNNDPPGLMRWFITNPHFCDMCVNTLKNISW